MNVVEEEALPRSVRESEKPRKPKPMKLPDEIDLERLCSVIARDWRDMEPFRRNRLEAVRQLGGARYGDDCAPKDVPVNLVGIFVKIMSRSLIANNPRVMYSTFDRSQQAAVSAMEQWANDEIVRENLVDVYGRVMPDALIWKGIVKIALATPADAVTSGWDLQAGQPFMELVDPEDYVCDQSAKQKENCSYEACRYRIPVSVANELYAKGKDDEFEESPREDVNYGGDQKISTLSHSTGRREEIEPHVDLWEVYLPRHKIVVTLRDASGIPDPTHDPVAVRPWVGPACGPYHWLGFERVPGQLEPKGPVMDLMPIHLAFNASWRKLIEETLRYKKIQAFRSTGTDEAKRLKDAIDGELVQMDQPESIVPVESGGASNAVLVMAQTMQQAFDFIGGNLSLLGGRGPQSKTATQDKMLNENANAGVADLQDQALAFVQRTMEAMNWYWWNHPTKVMGSQWSPPGLPGMKMNRQVTPQMRRGPMPHIKVDPYSLPRQTPQSRLGFINQVITTVAPMMGLLQQQGVMLDMNALLDIFAKYGSEPDLARIFQYVEPPQPTESASPQGAGMPAQTTRTYERYGAGGDGSPEEMPDLADTGGKMSGTVNPNQ